jgi:hypothetical protein
LGILDEFCGNIEATASKFNEFSVKSLTCGSPEADVMRYSIMEKYNKLETQKSEKVSFDDGNNVLNNKVSFRYI